MSEVAEPPGDPGHGTGRILAEDVHRLGDRGDDVGGLEDDDVGVGHKRDRASPLVGLTVENDGAGDRDSNAAARDDRVDLIQLQRRDGLLTAILTDRATVAGSGLLEGLVQAGRHDDGGGLLVGQESRDRVGDLGLLGDHDDLCRVVLKLFDHFVDDGLRTGRVLGGTDVVAGDRAHGTALLGTGDGVACASQDRGLCVHGGGAHVTPPSGSCWWSCRVRKRAGVP